MVCQHNRALLRHSGTVQRTVNVQTIMPNPRLMKKADQAETFPHGMTFPQEIMTMSNAREYTAIAALGVGLALAAAPPASAQWYGWSGPYDGYGACCGYGYAAYHPYYGDGYAPPYYYVFYHRPYYAYGYHPYSGYYGYHHRHYRYGYGRAHHRPYFGNGYGAYWRY
jgi:hypothetical protein